MVVWLAKGFSALDVEHQATEKAPVRLDERGGVSRIFHKKQLQQK